MISDVPSPVPAKVVLGIGAATWDHFVVVPEFPSDEGVTQTLGMAEQGGGPVATALCVLAALGTPAALLDTQGDDPVGQAILKELRAFGVRTHAVSIHPGAHSAQALILVRQQDGARHIFFQPADCPEPDATFALSKSFGDVGLLHLNGRHENAAREAMNWAKSAKIPVSFDGGAGRYRESIRDLVLGSSLRILAREFACQFTGANSIEDAAKALLQDGPELLVITDGVRGSWVWPRGGASFHEPAVPVRDVVDTTGCGDVYHGAFLHGWMQGWPAQKCAHLASKMAAETARGLGGRCFGNSVIQ
jgi:sulfofructose kinase